MNAALIDDLGDRVVLAAAAIGALVYLFRSIRNTIRFAQRIEKVVDNVEGQLYPNGGSSLRDAVNAIRKTQEKIAADLARHIDGHWHHGHKEDPTQPKDTAA